MTTRTLIALALALALALCCSCSCSCTENSESPATTNVTNVDTPPVEQTPAGTVEQHEPTVAKTSHLIGEANASEYKATIHWTSYGIPHIVADDLGSVAFGQGYAFARDHACVLADQVVRVKGERSRFFGPGDNNENIDSDFGFRALALHELAEKRLPLASAQTKEVVRGYVAGYNKYLKQVGIVNLPPDCAGAKWVRPLTDVDLFAHDLNLGILVTSGFFVEQIGAAQPGHPPKGSKTGSYLGLPKEGLPASNAWAIGRKRSETGAGLLVANPHLPWQGASKFYESHLIIPGKLNIYGANLLGAPLISIGFNEQIAWSHTFSASRRIAVYRLRLTDGRPTEYRVGSERRSMIASKHTIEVRQPDGSTKPMTRTLYRSHHGPILSGGPLGWTKKHAYAITDVTIGRTMILDQYLSMDAAKDIDEFKAAFAKFHTTPFVNTIFTDRKGNALYMDGSLVPNLTGAGLAAWQFARSTVPAVEAAWRNGIIALDGSMPMFELDPKSTAVPFSQAPQLLRDDFVANSNNTYWATNPSQLLSGSSPFFGDAEKELSPRTRMNLTILTESGATAASVTDGKFNFSELKSAILSNRALHAELLLEKVVARCKLHKQLAKACSVLENWDGRLDVDARGAVLWREFSAALFENGEVFEATFDAKQPVTTPRSLKPAPAKGPDPVVTALEQAMKQLAKAGIDPLKTTLGEVQYFEKGGKRFPVAGGGSIEGTTNMAMFAPNRSLTMFPGMARKKVINRRTGVAKNGYPTNYGTSFLLLVEMSKDGPKAEAIMTYSNSSDPRSVHFDDQTKMWPKKRLRPVRFSMDEIQADVAKKPQAISARRTTAKP